MSKIETKAERLWRARLAAYEAAKAALKAHNADSLDPAVEAETDRRADALAAATHALVATPCPDRAAMIVKLDVLALELSWYGGAAGDEIALPVIEEAKRFLALETDPGDCRLAA